MISAEFLRALRQMPAMRGVPVICCRVHESPFPPTTRTALELALRELGIRTFVDVALLRQQHGETAEETIRRIFMKALRQGTGVA